MGGREGSGNAVCGSCEGGGGEGEDGEGGGCEGGGGAGSGAGGSGKGGGGEGTEYAKDGSEATVQCGGGTIVRKRVSKGVRKN